MFQYQKNNTLEKRKNESEKIREKYPNRIPVIVERGLKSDIEEIDKNKFLVPGDLTVGQFMYIIRKRITLTPEKAMFIFINNTLPASATLMNVAYKEHMNEDGFLYVRYSGESTFGN